MSSAYRAGGLYRSGRGWPWGRGRRGLERWDWGLVRLLYEEICFTWVVRVKMLVFMFATERRFLHDGGAALSFLNAKNHRG